MHEEQKLFTTYIQKKNPEYFQNVHVLDVGSYDINGNNRFLFDKSCNYTGIDIIDGKNVDIVSECHEYRNNEKEIFDTIISTECFEHDMYYDKSIKNIIKLLKPGGMFLFTCATTGRPEHGTLRTTPEDSATTIADLPQQEIEWKNYYKNLTQQDIEEIIDLRKIFRKYKFKTNKKTFDLYFFGIKQSVNEKSGFINFLNNLFK